MGEMGSMMGGASLWAVLVLILLAVVTAGIIALVLQGFRGGAGGGTRTAQPGEEAREILRSRYAAGQIDEDEYLRRISGLAQR